MPIFPSLSPIGISWDDRGSFAAAEDGKSFANAAVVSGAEIDLDAAPIHKSFFLEERCLGDLDFAASLLESFSATSLERTRENLGSHEKRRSKIAGLAAHSLKGSAGILLADRLAEIARRSKSGMCRTIFAIGVIDGGVGQRSGFVQSFVANCIAEIGERLGRWCKC